jgi:hypothetical protein
MDSYLVGTAQLTTAGVALLKFIPGPGNHTYKAVFAGTKTNATSSSASALLMVSAGAEAAGATTLTASGSVGNYTLTATVATKPGRVPPTGVVHPTRNLCDSGVRRITWKFRFRGGPIDIDCYRVSSLSDAPTPLLKA